MWAPAKKLGECVIYGADQCLSGANRPTKAATVLAF